jgi:hypothetical protein
VNDDDDDHPPTQCPDMAAFVVEVRKALELDADATIETPDGFEVSAAEFVAEWDKVKEAERLELN